MPNRSESIRFLEGTDIIDLGFGGTHSERSPSAADRWMTCAGSVQLSKLFPNESSIYACEGTAAHLVREQCLRTGADVEDFIGKVIHTEGFYFEVMPEWVGYLQGTIDWAREISGKPGCEMVVEFRVDLSRWLPDDGGTLDLGIITKDYIYANDLKFGQGILVEAEKNKQQMLYAVGFWWNYARHKTKATKFRLMIDQPRARDGKGSWWDCTLEELLAFAEEAGAAGALTKDPDAPLKVSVKGCHFCNVFAHMACPAVHDFVQDALGINPDVPTIKGALIMPEIEKLDVERRLHIWKHWPIISKWGTLLKQTLIADAMAGDPTPGFKPVATEGDRMWTSEAEAIEFFKGKIPEKELFNKQLKSPAQIEKIAGTRTWAQAQALITRQEGPPALVAESDKRPALMNLMDMLPDIDDGDEDDDFDLIGNGGGEMDSLI